MASKSPQKGTIPVQAYHPEKNAAGPVTYVAVGIEGGIRGRRKALETGGLDWQIVCDNATRAHPYFRHVTAGGFAKRRKHGYGSPDGYGTAIGATVTGGTV